MNFDWQTILSIIGALGGIIALLRFYVEIKDKNQKPPTANIVLTMQGNNEPFFNFRNIERDLPREIEFHKKLSISNIGEESGVLDLHVANQKGVPKNLFQNLNVNLTIYNSDTKKYETWDGKINGRTGPLEVEMNICGDMLLGYDDVAVAEFLRDTKISPVWHIVVKYKTIKPNFHDSYKKIILQIRFESVKKKVLKHLYADSYYKETSKMLYRIATGEFPVHYRD